MMPILDELKFNISRFDHYYDSVNNKSNLYLTINTFVLGGMIGGYSALLTEHVCDKSWPELSLFIAIIVVNILAFIYTIKAIMPYVNKKPGNSFYYFGDIAKKSLAAWERFVIAYSSNDIRSDLTHQVHDLATGLSKKFNNLRCATICIAIELGLIILAGLYLLIFKIHFL